MNIQELNLLIFLLCIFIPVLYYLYKIISFEYCLKKLMKNVPGSKALPLIGNSLLLTGGQDDFFRLLISFAKKYGEYFVIWVGQRPFVFLQSAEAIQPILNSTLYIDKSYEYSFLFPWVGNAVLTSTGAEWHKQRKMLTPTFHSVILKDFLKPIHRNTNIFIERLYDEINNPIDIVPCAKRYTLSIMLETTMGYSSNIQYQDECAFSSSIEELSEILQRRFITPWLKPDFIFNLSSYGKRADKCVQIINTFTDKLIAKRKKDKQVISNGNQDIAKNKKNELSNTDKNRKALLDSLLELQNDPRNNFKDIDLRNQVNTFLFAGHDTTATALSWSLYVIGKHPDLQEQLLTEIYEVINDKADEFDMNSINKLPLLESCIKECLRLYPTVPLIARDLKQSVDIGSVTLPAGATVLINSYLLHRDSKYFPDPEIFKPDRFLDHNAPHTKNPYSYIPFSAGSRNCMGQRMAMMVLKISLSKLLLNYEVKSPLEYDSLNLMGEITLINKNGLPITFIPRN